MKSLTCLTLLLTLSSRVLAQSDHLSTEFINDSYREIPLLPFFDSIDKADKLNEVRKIGSKILYKNKNYVDRYVILTDANTGIPACTGNFLAFSNDYKLGFRELTKDYHLTGEVVNMVTCNIVKTIDVKTDTITSVAFNDQLGAIFIVNGNYSILVPISKNSKLERSIGFGYPNVVVGTFGNYRFHFENLRVENCLGKNLQALRYDVIASPLINPLASSPARYITRKYTDCTTIGNPYDYLKSTRITYGLYEHSYMFGENDSLLVSLKDGTLSERKVPSYASYSSSVSEDGQYLVENMYSDSKNFQLPSPSKKTMVFDTKLGKEVQVFSSEVNAIYLRDNAFYGLYSKLELKTTTSELQKIGFQALSVRLRNTEQLAKFYCSGKSYISVASISKDDKYLIVGCTEGDEEDSPLEKLHMYERRN